MSEKKLNFIRSNIQEFKRIKVVKKQIWNIILIFMTALILFILSKILKVYLEPLNQTLSLIVNLIIGFSLGFGLMQIYFLYDYIKEFIQISRKVKK